MFIIFYTLIKLRILYIIKISKKNIYIKLEKYFFNQLILTQNIINLTM